MSDRLTIRIDFDTKVKLNRIASKRGLTLSESIRELVNREVGSDPLTLQVEELKKLLAPILNIDVGQLVYHLARASVAPVAAMQIRDKASGDALNEQVKQAAGKIAAKIMETPDVR